MIAEIVFIVLLLLADGLGLFCFGVFLCACFQAGKDADKYHDANLIQRKERIVKPKTIQALKDNKDEQLAFKDMTIEMIGTAVKIGKECFLRKVGRKWKPFIFRSSESFRPRAIYALDANYDPKE